MTAATRHDSLRVDVLRHPGMTGDINERFA
ncbi:hypothetical protein SAMN05444050_3590 [Afipia sp. GAS231]|nr:hypothetical protein SAMN05444050_3590 [Afipia sp. GAS231]